MFFVPESPRWYFVTGQKAKAIKVLGKIFK